MQAKTIGRPGAQVMTGPPPKKARPTTIAPYLYLSPVIIATIVLTIIPFLYTVYISFTNYSLFHFQEFNWVGFENYRNVLLESNEFFPVLGWTVTWMVLTSLLNVFGGMGLAMLLNHPGLRERNIYRTLLVIPWALPFILMVQVWAGLYNNRGPINLILANLGLEPIKWLTDTSSSAPPRAALLIMNLWLSYPFFMTVCLAALQAIPVELYEATDLDGANGWQRFRAITWPFMLAAITPLLITQLAGQFVNAGPIILLTNGNPIAFQGATYGVTDTLSSYSYKLIHDLRQYGLSAAYSIVIFVCVAAFTIINSFTTRAFKEEE
jgi:arabinogalactan oligomer/maltooligosaccharide transport system permease protein